MSSAPIALFVYNRPDHTRRTVESLRQNKLAGASDLLVFSDAPKSEAQARKVGEVREYIRTIDGFKSVTVHERDHNFGLARSIIDGVTAVVNQYGRVIVLEDDMVTSPYFLAYMNDALDLYDKDDRVICIHGYSYPIAGLPETFFLRDTGCWGWATWKRGWDEFEPDGRKLLSQIRERRLEREFDYADSAAYTDMLEQQLQGRNDSWAVRWYASAFLLNKLTLHPGRSLVQNIGNDGTGRHKGKSNEFVVDLADRPIKVEEIEVAESEDARSKFIKYFLAIRPPAWRRFARWVREGLYRIHAILSPYPPR